MVINTNIQASAAATRLMHSSTALGRSLQRLSSGSKITSPADDSAGLAVSMKLNAQIARINAASNNVGNAISFSQTQDGYLQKASDALTRMSELSVFSCDVTKTDADRALYDLEFQALDDFLVEMAGKDFNGVSLFSGATLNVTTDSEANTFAMAGVDLINILEDPIHHYHIDDLGNSYLAVGGMKGIIQSLAAARANVGSNIETLTYYHEQLAALKNNLSAANSRITDVDVAQESTAFAKFNVLTMSGTAMLAQANAMPQQLLKLFG